MSTPMATASTVEAPVTARAFLLGDEGAAQLRARLAASKGVQDALGGRPGRAIARMLDEQVADMAAGFLDVDLGGVALRGWALHERLRKAAFETAAAPGSMCIVDLANHTVSSTWRPRIELVVGGAARAHVAFELTVAFEVSGLAGVVEEGLLVRLGGGTCLVSVRFGVAGQTLAERSARFDPGLAIPLGRGVPLIQGVASRAERAAREDETEAVISLPRDRVSPERPGVSL